LIIVRGQGFVNKAMMQTICYAKDDDDKNKRELISDWQNVLSQRWIDVLFNATSTKANEPWFNSIDVVF
jgi:hypothetical protein